MDVIINDFEAVTETPARPMEAPAIKASGEAAAQPLQPQDLEPKLRLLAERALRSFAH